MASTTPTQIRIEKQLKEQANALFANLGLDMSSAVTIFLRQCVLRGGLPFSVELPEYNQETLEAMIEARRISKDHSVPSFSSVEEMVRAIEAEDD